MTAGVPTALLDRLVADLAGQPVPFEVYMEAALYDDEAGYFATGRLRSDTEGDFLTSPEVSPLFGETLAVFAERERERIGGTQFGLVEIGAGSGSLIRPLVEAFGAGFQPLVAIERSPAARRSLAAFLGESAVVDSIGELPRLRGVILANELLDNVAMALAVRSGSGWTERWVGSDGHELHWVEAPVRGDVAAWLERWAGEVGEGGIVEVQLGAQALAVEAFQRLERGAVVFVDYGDTMDGLANRRAAGTIRTYQGHHLGPDPLSAPGETDLTADVNFSAIGDALRDSGAAVELVRQADLLADLGLRERLERMREDELAAARDGEVMRRLELRSARTAGETLLHPRGLGDFRVLIARR
jgi:SAM-dependent MidA family methyltransferase